MVSVVNQNQQKQKQVEIDKKMVDLEKEIKKAKCENAYEQGLNIVIELLEMGCRDTIVLFAAAEFYFMAGDYDRSVQWIDNTLAVDPKHINARILLSRICILEDRFKDGLSIVTVILNMAGNVLTKTQEHEIKDLLAYYKSTESELIMKQYPTVAEFLGLSENKEVVQVEDDVLSEEQHITELNCQSEDEVLRTKEKSLEEIKSEILDQHISLSEKIKLCNAFAGAYYYKGQFAIAEELLAMALNFDGTDYQTLRNLVCVSVEQKNEKLALEYASQMKETNFMLLQYIREHFI